MDIKQNFKDFLNEELSKRIAQTQDINESVDPIVLKALAAAVASQQLQTVDHNRRINGRVAIVNRVRNDKIQMQKKESTTKGYKIVNGQAVKMSFTEMKRRKIAAKIASRKRKTEQAVIDRKRKISLNLRKASLS